MRVSFLAGTALALLFAGPADAAWDDWSLAPLTGFIGDDLAYSVGGQVNGSVFDADQPGSFDKFGGTGAASLNASLQRDYDSGLSLALKTTFELYHDKLSGDNYGSDLVQKVYGSANTGLGRVDVGMTDGAAYALSVTGPTVNGEVTIDNPNATFFRDPSTGTAFINVFALNSAVESSLNYAKVSYYSPRLFGLQLAASFTPSEGKDVIPFLSNGPNVPNRQKSLWEGAFNYNDSFGPLTLSAYGGLIVGHGDRKTPGHAGLTDWGVGSELDWAIDDDTKLAVGGAFREANTYTFDINDAFAAGATRSLHLSTVLTRGSWSLGGEFGNGDADGALGAPTLGVHAYMVDAAYAVNGNLQLSGGWQQLHYARSAGAFYNGAPHIAMDAVFLHAVLNI
ncbi:MAG TPA: hypothetical protein VNU97_09765 [Rhizomicrobium sp.]|jgi:hypothetical protein|nr:hypothetical protein [Rhizomicrobium sp.]